MRKPTRAAVTNTLDQEWVDVEGEKTWVSPAGMDQPAITIDFYPAAAIDSADFEANATDYSYSFPGPAQVR